MALLGHQLSQEWMSYSSLEGHCHGTPLFLQTNEEEAGSRLEKNSAMASLFWVLSVCSFCLSSSLPLRTRPHNTPFYRLGGHMDPCFSPASFQGMTLRLVTYTVV